MVEWRKKIKNNELTKPGLIKADWFMTFPWLIHKNTVQMQHIPICPVHCKSQQLASHISIQ